MARIRPVRRTSIRHQFRRKHRVRKRHGRLASVIVAGDSTRSVGRTTVYVQLLNEDVDVWRPVVAEHVEGDRYRLIGPRPDDETWPFAVGDVVRCEPRRLSGGVVPVACEKWHTSSGTAAKRIMRKKHPDGTRCLEGTRGAPRTFRSCCDFFEGHLSSCVYDIRFEWHNRARQWEIPIAASAGGGSMAIRYCPHCGARLRAATPLHASKPKRMGRRRSG